MLRIRARRITTTLLGAALTLSLTAPVVAVRDELPLRQPPSRRTPQLEAAAVPGRLIVRWRADASASERGKVRRGEGVSRLRRLGHADLELVSTRGRSAAAVAARLARRGDVLYVEPDYLLRRTANPKNETYFDELWGLHNTGQSVFGTSGTPDVDIDLPQAARTTLGSPKVVVAVIDDGVDLDHPDLADRAWRNPGETGAGRATNGIDDDGNGYVDDVHGWDFLNNNASVHDRHQDYHGTHVAGTIAASLNGVGVVGVAPRTRIMALKFLGDDGGSVSDAIRALRYAKAKGADVVNASWGGPDFSKALRDAIADSGLLMVASAGNSSLDNDTDPLRAYPAAFDLPNIITVAAVDAHGALASFSNYGATSVDIAAPGVSILSSLPDRYLGFMDGTSMAAPHVTGVAALVLSLDASLAHRPRALRRWLMATGEDAPATAGSTVSGKIVNARLAVDLAAPKASAPRLTMVTGMPASAAGIQVRTKWSADDHGTGVAAFQAQRRIDGGAWQTLHPADALSTSILRRLAPEHDYQFRVRAWDEAGNRSAWATSPEVRLVVRNEGIPALTTDGSWTHLAGPEALGGRLLASDEAGASAELRFQGSAVAWIAERGPGHGEANVFINGALVATLDLEAPGARPRRVVFARNWKTTSVRTLRIEVVGTAGRPTVTIDAFAWQK